MSVGQTFLSVGAAIGVACALCIGVIVLAKFRRGRDGARSRALLAPHRRALIVMVSGEDVDGQAKGALHAVPAPTWDRLRPSVVAFLRKVRGAPADDLGELLSWHGEVDEAKRLLTSRSAAWWRLEGWWASLRGKKQVWGTMTRQGFGENSPAVTAGRADV